MRSSGSIILDGEVFPTMEQIARSSIVTGTCAMPILSGLCDTDENLGIAVRWTAEWGAEFVPTGGSLASKTG
jgi:hypothetical protein